MLTIAVPRETLPGELRVAQVPDTTARLVAAGADVRVQAGAGERAGHRDDAYAQAGAKLVPDARALYAGAGLVLKVREPRQDATLGTHELELMDPGTALVSFLNLQANPDLLERLLQRRITAFAMEQMPRTTRAQRMDALSSMSTVAGYKAVLLAANTLGRFFPLLMTAAGTIAPTRAFVLGAGVAGLQAIATARRLGAVVEAFDVRPAVREEVQSLGATFVATELASESNVAAGGYAKQLSHDDEARERELLHKHVAASDVVIATANIPGRRAPVLVTAAMVEDMRQGSVIVDLAAETGGNCELTKPGETVVVNGVTILGPVNLAAALPVHASQMYARNLLAFTQLVLKDGALNFDFSDDIVAGTCVARDGARPAGAAPPAPTPVPAAS